MFLVYLQSLLFSDAVLSVHLCLISTYTRLRKETYPTSPGLDGSILPVLRCKGLCDAAKLSTRFERWEKASNILCCECSRISSMTSDPVEKSSISASLITTGKVSVGAAGTAADDSSIVLVVVAGLGGFEISSRPSIQTTIRSALVQVGKKSTYHIEIRHR
jgi:hypothetical protein